MLTSGEVLSADGETYSDLGYILWGFAAEDALGTPLSQLLKERLFVALEIHNMTPSPGPRPEVAQCRLSNDREIELAREQGFQIAPVRQIPHGTVQDGNARFLGGMAGNAGLFGTASAMWKLGREWLAPGRVLQTRDVADALGYGERYALGWWWRRMRGHAGPALSPRAFGMVGSPAAALDDRGGCRGAAAHRRSPTFDLAPGRRPSIARTDVVAEMRPARANESTRSESTGERDMERPARTDGSLLSPRRPLYSPSPRRAQEGTRTMPPQRRRPPTRRPPNPAHDARRQPRSGSGCGDHRGHSLMRARSEPPPAGAGTTPRRPHRRGAAPPQRRPRARAAARRSGDPSSTDPDAGVAALPERRRAH